jgi:hypothetical protein
VGHLILRYYRVVHWSWWIFGATVVVAAGVAGTVVTFLQLTNYDLRHYSVVMGTVGSSEATAVGYYGVYAPRSGPLEVSQPAGAGMNYITPLTVPTQTGVRPFADPQSYQLWTERAHLATPVFRNTLKKMQGRWKGKMPGIEGDARVEGIGSGMQLKGTLTNNSGYSLEDVEIIVHSPALTGVSQGVSYVFNVGKWPAGKALTLDSAKLVKVGKTPAPAYLEDVLGALARKKAGRILGGLGGSGLLENDLLLTEGRSEDLLVLLLDARRLETLAEPARVEPTRTLVRTVDCTKLLHAHGGLIVARSGKILDKNFVKSPVPLSVNGRPQVGKGEVLFAWGLPIGGRAGAGAEAGERPALEPGAGGGAPTRPRLPLLPSSPNVP